jgi:hypothetical protein
VVSTLSTVVNGISSEIGLNRLEIKGFRALSFPQMNICGGSDAWKPLFLSVEEHIHVIKWVLHMINQWFLIVVGLILSKIHM